MRKSAGIIKDLLISILVGGFLFVGLTAIRGLRAHSDVTAADSIVDQALSPGAVAAFALVNLFGGGIPDSRSVLTGTALFILVAVLNAGFYSVVTFTFLCILRAIFPAPEGAPSQSAPAPRPGWRAWTSLPIGFALAVAATATWSLSGYWPGPDAPWFVPGFRVYYWIFGIPGHSEGGLWVVATGLVNISFYSLVVFLLGRSFGIWRTRSG
jgi:hypothetical protein